MALYTIPRLSKSDYDCRCHGKIHLARLIGANSCPTIEFAGLYYGTDGQFFKGTFTGGLPEVTDVNFESKVKHIQGFIAGILVAAIAFTGLYYGTDRQFLSGNMSYTLPLVTDASFENEYLITNKRRWAVRLYQHHILLG